MHVDVDTAVVHRTAYAGRFADESLPSAERCAASRDPLRRRLLALADVGAAARSPRRSPCSAPAGSRRRRALLFAARLDPGREAATGSTTAITARSAT